MPTAASIAFLLAGASGYGHRPDPATLARYVVDGHDGDTLRAIDAEEFERRMILAGIDASEHGEPFSSAAR